jgi:hypothetical protein
MDNFFCLSATKVSVITFLIPGSGSCLLSMRTCRQEQALVWGRHRHHCLTKMMKEAFEVTCVTKTHGVCLVRVMDTPVVLSHKDGLGTNMVMLVSNVVSHCDRLITASSRLVVATRLHQKLSSFCLRISSNMSSYSKESIEWNTLANPIRYALSILQYWLEKWLDEPAQFKARLPFRRAHQLGKLTFKQASAMEYGFNCTDSEVKRNFTNLAIGFFLGKDW